MRRAKELRSIELSRREVCGGIAACLGLAFSGCMDGDTGVIQTGPLGTGNDGDHSPDASTGGGGGGGGGSGTGSGTGSGSGSGSGGGTTGATCPSTGAVDVGAPSAFAMNTPKYFSSGGYFVVRDAGGLYALSSKCTHEGATNVVQNSQFYCPRHGAKFTYNGDIVSGPVVTGLVHYSMCTLANGNVGVVKTMTVAKTVRLNV
jgi:nitrite reductase/ring-hydroxylating ferredoxin subunit